MIAFMRHRWVPWRYVAEGASVPWYMGCVESNFLTGNYLIAPVPLNIVMRWIRLGWCWLRIAKMTNRERMDFRVQRASTALILHGDAQCRDIARELRETWESLR